MPDMYKVFISAGDSSGDIHGANLMSCMKEKNPRIQFYGLGKNRMKQAGLHCLHDMSAKSLMWLHVLTELTTFFNIKKDCVRFLQRDRPRVVILIDYCGFNFHLARAAKKLKIPVVYYICPQLWAHGPWRVKKMKKLVDKLIVIYPFEKPFYEAAAIPVTYVGHPLFDEMHIKAVDEGTVSELKKTGEPIISFLPGSRRQEIVRLLPLFLRAAELIYQSNPAAQFLVSCSEEHYAPLIQDIVRQTTIPCKIIQGSAHEIIKASSLCIAGAGTITLQIASYLKPMVILYKVSPFAYFIARPFLTTPYIGLVNALAQETIVPELLMCRKNYRWLAREAMQLLSNSQKRQACIDELTSLIGEIGRPGASEHAAEEIVKLL
ncbi:MAG: lipid-A-disaccharide synthase [Candidatus Brocadia sp.]|uniref:Lipid-A-disaccharide synthase n=1 Tax=Candidatus Brocadia fulgida TaxID=380242 RepID=A0A0M2UXT8_9BACT|nr:MAG: lipid-A-disaccharide synthase [Candidatus Brocadia fulgida]MBV6519073.1 Lipid-A-disaccharide synthase [Candidatus Brocadia fulgida]MCE7911732.1 lipid-A-disaccharide synthase [Candidatus Brocadia sp. AMX3]MDG5995712.1 lipid-A-disaccharide synthase [Candidatus Brocadia sp.]RIJ97509.1 MAG: lipid-A-disaccharide synthase [Candidatus Brocadia sp.]